jgi:glucose-1-phosphate thymidylyltransferase
MQKSLVIALPMAGWGTRMRPHTWNKPKQLCRLAGATTLDYVMKQFAPLHDLFEQVSYVFIISSQDHHQQINRHMQQFFPDLKVTYVFQTEMNGQSGAIKQSQEHLTGPMIMSFPDTLIDTEFTSLVNDPDTAVAWGVHVNEPQHYGIAHLNDEGLIDHIVEKPEKYIGNLAMVGAFYFPSGEELISAIDRQMERGIKKDPNDPKDRLTREYYIVPAINIMIAEDNLKMRVIQAPAMHDTGRPDAMIATNQYVLQKYWQDHQDDIMQRFGNDVIIHPPVAIGDGVQIKNSIIGPNVSIAENTFINDAAISNSIIGSKCQIEQVRMKNSLIGDEVTIIDTRICCRQLNLGDNASMTVENAGEEKKKAIVTCRSSATYAERPVSFEWGGNRLEIDAILSRWRTQFGRGFRVRTKNNRQFTLFYDEGEDDWLIEVFADKP